jgi:hypothetical protein
MLFLIMFFSFLGITAILLGIETGRAIKNHFIKKNRKNEYQDKVIDLFMKIIVEDIRSNNVKSLEYTAEWLSMRGQASMGMQKYLNAPHRGQKPSQDSTQHKSPLLCMNGY